MIWESHYWRRELIKYAQWLKKRTEGKRWLDSSQAKLEKSTMIGFYTIRKLIEANKLPNAIAEQNIQLNSFTWLGEPVTLKNWHKIDELYDLVNPTVTTRNLTFVCNQFIHSFVNLPCSESTALIDSIYMASERERHNFLYQISISKIVELFEEIACHRSTRTSLTFNPKKGDFDVDCEILSIT